MAKRDKIEKDLFNLPSGYRILMKQARKRDKYFSITPDFYEALSEMDCFYCGDKITHRGTKLDRVDNKGHYTIDNIVPCCKHCNFGKRQMDVEDFISWAEKIVKNSDKIRSTLPKLKFNKDSGI